MSDSTDADQSGTEEGAVKRGGRVSIISLDLDWAEDQFRIEPPDPAADPEVRQTPTLCAVDGVSVSGFGGFPSTV